jgi:hypothetical protein
MASIGSLAAPPLLELSPKGWGGLFFLAFVICFIIAKELVNRCLKNQRESYSDYKYQPLTNQLLLPGAYRGK